MRTRTLAAFVATSAVLAACGAAPTPTQAPKPAPQATSVPAAAAPSAATATRSPVTTAAPRPVPATDLPGTSWSLVMLDGRPAVTGTSATLNFGRDGRADGSDGCNSFSGSYSASGSTLTFGPIAATLKACPDPIAQQAQVFQNALGRTAAYQIEGGQLSLKDASGKVMATFAPQATGLGGSAWIATGYNNGKQAVVSLINGTRITAAFSPEGTLAGSAGCNDYSGPYKSTAATISIGPLATTMKMCADPAGVMDQESQYLAAIQTATTYRIDANRLELRDAGGALQATYQRAPSAAPATPAAAGASAAPTASAAGLTPAIKPEQIRLDTQGLPYSWVAVSVPATPYDASQPPGPKGLPQHIEILFGATSPSQRQPGTPVMYLIPVAAYEAMWNAAGNPSVSRTMAQIYSTTISLAPPAGSTGLPALPYEEKAGTNDLAVQLARAKPTAQSATKNGYRFVGRWSQGPNPVTDQGLTYVYQGFTNDGTYLVSFYYPVSSPAIPNTASDVPQAEMQALNSDPTAYMKRQTEKLNALPANAWSPDLNQLDSVVGSLQIAGMPPNGLVGTSWQVTSNTTAPGAPAQPIANPDKYTITYGADGTLTYKADCNSGSAGYTVDGGVMGGIRTTPGPATLAECGPASSSSLVAGTIASAQNYRVQPKGTQLELIRPAGGGSLWLTRIAK